MSRQKNLFFVMKIDENVPLTIFQDENRVGQILVNIISNAVKYTFNGQVSIIAESCYPLDEIKFIIKDSGKGINKLSKVG
jgi:signal transduction histidine kinase